jgi:hypothetical protein
LEEGGGLLGGGEFGGGGIGESAAYTMLTEPQASTHNLI